MTANQSLEHFQVLNQGRVKKANAVIMHRPLGELQVEDHKLFSYLLNRAYHRLSHRDPVHRIPLLDAVEFIGGSATVQSVNESLRRLGEVNIEIDYEDVATGEKRMMLVHFLSFDSTTSRNGILEFAFDPMLLDLLREPAFFATLSLHHIRRFKTLAGERLYEKMMVQNASALNKTWRVSISEFYTFCQIFDVNSRFDNFRKRVLVPAVDEVNEHAPFSVDVRYIHDAGRGRKVQWIEFTPVPKTAQDLLTPPKNGSKRVARDKRSIDLFDKKTDEERGSTLVISEQAYAAAEGMIEGTRLDALKIEGDFRKFAESRVIKDADQQFLNFVAAQLEREKDPTFRAIDEDVIADFLK